MVFRKKAWLCQQTFDIPCLVRSCYSSFPIGNLIQNLTGSFLTTLLILQFYF